MNTFRAQRLDAAQKERCNIPWLFLLLSAVMSFCFQPCSPHTLKDLRETPGLTEKQGTVLDEY